METKKTSTKGCCVPACDAPHAKKGFCNKHYQAQPHKRAQKRDLYQRSKEKQLRIARERYQQNPLPKIQNAAKWHAANREKSNAHKGRWRKENKGAVNSFTRARQIRKLKATPKWADKQAIKEFYEKCPPGYHVDHIIPIKGQNVSGLHVLENLQYLPALENIRKSNKFNPEEHQGRCLIKTSAS